MDCWPWRRRLFRRRRLRGVGLGLRGLAALGLALLGAEAGAAATAAGAVVALAVEAAVHAVRLGRLALLADGDGLAHRIRQEGRQAAGIALGLFGRTAALAPELAPLRTLRPRLALRALRLAILTLGPVDAIVTLEILARGAVALEALAPVRLAVLPLGAVLLPILPLPSVLPILPRSCCGLPCRSWRSGRSKRAPPS